MARALDDLTLDGVVLLSNVDGRYVGDSEFDTVRAALDDRRAMVLLHPNEIPLLEPEARFTHGPSIPSTRPALAQG